MIKNSRFEFPCAFCRRGFLSAKFTGKFNTLRIEVVGKFEDDVIQIVLGKKLCTRDASGLVHTEATALIFGEVVYLDSRM
jgi:hypothetical protein